MLLIEHLHTFLALAPVKRGFSRNTVKEYGYICRQFCAFAGETATLEAFTEESLLAFSNHKLSQREYAPGTVNNIRAALIAWGEWLVKSRLIPYNPARAVLESVKRVDPVTYEITSEDAFALIDACDRIYYRPRRLLCRAVLCLLVHAGLRRGEMQHLTLQDFCKEQAEIKVWQGKGRKNRTVPLCAAVIEALCAYLEVRPPDCRPEALRRNSLFMMNRQQPLGYKGIDNIIGEACALALYKKKVTPHSFRHCFINRLLQNGVDVTTVSKIVGHSKPSTTFDVYTRTNVARMRAAVDLSTTLPLLPGQAPPEPAPEPVPPSRSKRIDLHKRRLSR